MQDYLNDVLSSSVFPRDFSRGYLKREEVMKIGNTSSRREHSTVIRTATEVGCFFLDILLVLAGHLMSFWLRFESGFASGPLFTDSFRPRRPAPGALLPVCRHAPLGPLPATAQGRALCLFHRP